MMMGLGRDLDLAWNSRHQDNTKDKNRNKPAQFHAAHCSTRQRHLPGVPEVIAKAVDPRNFVVHAKVVVLEARKAF